MQQNCDLALKQRSYTYQHLHGVMLFNLNHLAYELKLSHCEYHLMGVLIGYWNKQHGKSFPTVKLLSKQARMSNSTVLKSLKRLTDCGLVLIIKDGKNGRQNYYINQQKFLNTKSNETITTTVTQNVIPCSNAYIYNKQNNNLKKKPSLIKTSSLKTIKKSNDDEIINLQDMNILNQLDKWGFTDSQKILELNGMLKIKKLFQVVEQQNPQNPGAYLRALLSQKEVMNHLEDKTQKNSNKTPEISRKLQAKYWKHIPTGKIYKIRPDVGNHLLIKYFADEKKVMMLENSFIGLLEDFEECKGDVTQTNNDTSLTKDQRIKSLFDAGKLDEAKMLERLWKKAQYFTE